VSGQVVQHIRSSHFHASVSPAIDTKFTVEIQGIIIIYKRYPWHINKEIFAMTALLEHFDHQFKFTLVHKKWSLYLN